MDLWFWLFAALLALALGALMIFRRALLLVPFAGALAAFLVSIFTGLPPYLEPLALVGGAALALLVLFLLPRRRLTPLETMVGKTCTVTERIAPLTGGQVTVDGNLWAARSLSSDAAYEVGAELSVVAIEGVKLICG